jgi:hypothetical protein
MLRRFALADENDRDFPSVAFFQPRILVNIHFMKDRPELLQNGGDGCFRFLAKVASGTRVQRDVARPASSDAQLL